MRKEWGVTAWWVWGLGGGEENVLKLDCSDGCKPLEYTKHH